MNKMRGKKWVFTAVLVCSILFSGCSNRNTVKNYEEKHEKIQTITFFGNKYEPENVAIIEEIISDFMKKNPEIRVSYESLKGTDYFDALEKRMAAGKGDDVFMVNHDILLKLKENSQLTDLSGISSIPEYTDLMIGQMEKDGHIYWVPTIVSAFGLYCNLDILKEYGQEVPENLEEWKEVCAVFKEHGLTPIIANNDISLKTLAIGAGFYSVYEDHGQEETFAKLNSGSEELSQYLSSGFSIAEELIQEGYIDASKALETKKTADDLEEFVKGRSPFMLTGAWAAGRVSGMNPEFEFEVAPLPVLEDGAMLVINADVRLSVNAHSENKEAALKFVEFFTKEENIRKFVDQQCSFSPLKQGTPSTVDTIAPLVSCYQEERTVIGTDGLLDLPIWNLTEEVSKQLLSGESLEETMRWMDQKAAAERGKP